MPIIIGLLILIILLMIFGPWLLLALGIVIAAIIAAVVWVVKTLLVPVGIILLVGLTLAAVVFVALAAWVGIDKVVASLSQPRRSKALPTRPLPPFVKPRASRRSSRSELLEEQRRVYDEAIRLARAEGRYQEPSPFRATSETEAPER